VRLIYVAQADLEIAGARGATWSARVMALAGVPSVAEAAALAACGPKGRLILPRIAVGPVAYVRFHGGVGKYWGRYSDDALLGWSDWAAEQSRQGRSVWCYFNNDIHGHAIHDAQTLKSMVGQI